MLKAQTIGNIGADPELKYSASGSPMLRLNVGWNDRARRLLGWSPTWSLDDGLAATVEWIRAHLDFYRVGRYEV